jgi:hypothetical protein
LPFGVDAFGIVAQQQKLNIWGGGINYALDDAVPKIEAGANSEEDQFGTLGCDFFLGDWSINPQFTRFKTPTLGIFSPQHLGYLPLKYTKDPWILEFQFYRNFDSLDIFLSSMITFSITQNFSLTGYAQDYEGDPNSLFGVYRKHNGGGLFGIRAEYNVTLN